VKLFICSCRWQKLRDFYVSDNFWKCICHIKIARLDKTLDVTSWRAIDLSPKWLPTEEGLETGKYGFSYLYTIFIPIPFLSYFSVHFITFDLIEFYEVSIFDILVAIASSAIPPVFSQSPLGQWPFWWKVYCAVILFYTSLKRFHITNYLKPMMSKILMKITWGFARHD